MSTAVHVRSGCDLIEGMPECLELSVFLVDVPECLYGMPPAAHVPGGCDWMSECMPECPKLLMSLAAVIECLIASLNV
jgi:hypothetical protein